MKRAALLVILGLTACDQVASVAIEHRVNEACEEVFLSHFVNPRGVDVLGSSLGSTEYPFERVRAEQEQKIAEIDSENGKEVERMMIDIIKDRYGSGRPYINHILTLKYGVGSARREFLCSTVDDGRSIKIKELVFESRSYDFMILPLRTRLDLKKTSFTGEIE